MDSGSESKDGREEGRAAIGMGRCRLQGWDMLLKAEVHHGLCTMQGLIQPEQKAFKKVWKRAKYPIPYNIYSSIALIPLIPDSLT